MLQHVAAPSNPSRDSHYCCVGSVQELAGADAVSAPVDVTFTAAPTLIGRPPLCPAIAWSGDWLCRAFFALGTLWLKLVAL